MRILIAEDDYVSRTFLYKFLSNYGECDVTVDGIEALEVFIMSLDEGQHYDLICLDIMMPEVDGVNVLKTIRVLEDERKIPADKKSKVIMTTALNATEKVKNAFEIGAEGYAVKPIDIDKFVEVLRKLELIEQ
ncbi:response regulator [Fusibacter ferrireducens]|uniref:Stage 0 sporulation protein A homolog n=1 Tax=Fusibacter ferrireducens TaxID=2785058 RepID=A0ABR9ZQM6_9FIRM|nr:response regulator [Fusibacter ferrireducens]MBF4692762.1 response regulator [Fusibacter ferrireducens]